MAPIMRKSKISAPVGFNPKPSFTALVAKNQDYRRMYNEYLRAWYSSDDGGMSWKRETQQETKTISETQNITAYNSMMLSLDLIPTGKFITIEFINKYGNVSRYNGRTGVKKYLKYTGYKSEQTRAKYFILWVRRGSKSFDGVAMIDKTKILRLSAGGVVLWSNQDSQYTKTV